MLLNKSDKIGQYTVTFPIKKGDYAESYRVKDESGKNYFLKIFNYASLHRTQFDEDGNVLEIEISKQLHHPNVISYHDDGELMKNEQRYAYIVYDFISGETAAERTGRDQGCTASMAKTIVEGVLEGLIYLHGLPRPVLHNELTIQNVMLDLTKRNPKPVIIDFGYARYYDQGKFAFQKQGLNPFYVAPESISGIFTKQSDIFAVGAMLYHLLYGLPPYFVDVSKFKNDERSIEEVIAQEREKPLRIFATSGPKADGSLINVIAKALAIKVDDRFQSADEFLRALRGEIQVTAPVQPVKWDVGPQAPSQTQAESSESEVKVERKPGNGFKDVAGMTELKEQLTSDVIGILKEPERAAKLGLHLPNGILFYGPPGCGKSYFAEKFAEEVGCNYMYVQCSDIASPYIHGGQGKIAAIFEEAKKNTPIIIFLDEVEVMLRDRSLQDNSSMAGEVNEFLTRLNNCGKNGILVIGATNDPTNIDKAVLRAGRLEYKYYVPLPDDETRKQLFIIHLRDKTKADDIDYDKLSELTKGFASVDIEFIVQKAGREIFKENKDEINMGVLQDVIKKSKPSVSADDLRKHELLHGEFEQQKRNKIGF